MERVMTKIEKDGDTGCWLWKGQLFHDGYGKTWYNGKGERLHRVMYAIANGLEMSDLDCVRHVVCGKLGNKHCCNPDHLENGSHEDNMRDMVKDGHAVGGRPKGAKSRTWEEKVEITVDRLQGATIKELSKRYNITKRVIQKYSNTPEVRQAANEILAYGADI